MSAAGPQESKGDARCLGDPGSGAGMIVQIGPYLGQGEGGARTRCADERAERVGEPSVRRRADAVYLAPKMVGGSEVAQGILPPILLF